MIVILFPLAFLNKNGYTLSVWKFQFIAQRLQAGTKVSIGVECKASSILIIHNLSPPNADFLFMVVVKKLNFQFTIFFSLEEFPRNTQMISLLS